MAKNHEKEHCEETVGNLQNIIDNQYVRAYRNNHIYYTEDFYVAMHKHIQSGMTYVKAYEACGFDIDKTGLNRAYAAGQRAEKMAKAGKLGRKKMKQKAFYGGTPSSEMTDLEGEELIAYLTARVLYLEHIENAKKKVLSDLMARNSHSM